MYTSVSLTPTFFACWGAHGLRLAECIRIMVVSVCQVRPGCFLVENPLWLVGAPVRLAASLRLLAREGCSRNVNYCLFFSRDPLAAGRSAGPLCGVATLAGPRGGLSQETFEFSPQVFQRTTGGWSECRSVQRRRYACRSARGSLAIPGTGARDTTHGLGG